MKGKYYLFIYDRYGWCEKGIFEDIVSARKYINKMKPCKNKDCYNYNELQKYNCNIWRLVTNCHVYLDKPKISPWELFRELDNKYKKIFWLILREKYKIHPDTAIIMYYPEQKALEILQKIEGELEC